MYSETSTQRFSVDEGLDGLEPDRVGGGDALGGAHEEVAAGPQRVRRRRPVQRVADGLGEVDDGVAAEHEVVGGGPRRHTQQVADLEAGEQAQLGLRHPLVVALALERRARSWSAGAERGVVDA